jgi:hypothetical protein
MVTLPGIGHINRKVIFGGAENLGGDQNKNEREVY